MREGTRALGWVAVAIASWGSMCGTSYGQRVPDARDGLPPIPQGTIQVRLQIVADGLAGQAPGNTGFQVSPSDLAPDGTGRLFISTLGGVVRIIDRDGTLLDQPFLTKTQTNTTVPSNGEWGMSSIVFHPDFANVGTPGYGKFYTITTEPRTANGGNFDFGTNANSHQDVIKEWTLADHTANVWGANAGDSVRTLMRVGQPGEPHNVVDLAFGPDKMLYISSGDGGFGNQLESQKLNSVYGNVMRIDPLRTSGPGIARTSSNGQYGIPDDNPFVNDPNAMGEIFAYGFRSPFRMNFDRETGDLWVADVGQGRIEEVNLVVAGGNYGWNIKEGQFRSGQGEACCRVEPDMPELNGGITLKEEFNLIDPIFEYDHEDGLCIIGGFIYHGNLFPELRGKYVFADLGEQRPTARLFYGDPETGEIFEFLIDPLGDKFVDNLNSLPGGGLMPLPERIISIGEDEHGELYLLAVGRDPRQGGGIDGMVIRLIPEPGSLALLLGGCVVWLRRRRRE